jgi:hypothetical protein
MMRKRKRTSKLKRLDHNHERGGRDNKETTKMMMMMTTTTRMRIALKTHDK